MGRFHHLGGDALEVVEAQDALDLGKEPLDDPEVALVRDVSARTGESIRIAGFAHFTIEG